jgi:L-fuculose-phosphate aldolase
MVYYYPQLDIKSDTNEVKREIVSYVAELNRLGLNRGSSGNISVRMPNGFYITPSGATSSNLTEDLLVQMDFDGNVIDGENPSSEWRFHRDILIKKPDINAIVHTHSTYATAFSCLRTSLPAFHYMIAIAGGDDVICAEYALFGSQKLSDNVLKALKDRNACFLANHGTIAIGSNLKKALNIAIELESLSQQFMILKSTNDFVLLNKSEMSDVIERFKSYGNWNK